MAGEPLPANYLKAGADYLRALIALGLRPDFLAWGQQTQTSEWMLVMVTPIIEVGGPLALNKLLFRAYNMNATPQEISPFIVRVYGTRTRIGPQLQRFVEQDLASTRRIKTVDAVTGRSLGEMHSITSMKLNASDFEIQTGHIYSIPGPTKKNNLERSIRDWNRFKTNVERLAA
jgi:hypothetical protein